MKILLMLKKFLFCTSTLLSASILYGEVVQAQQNIPSCKSIRGKATHPIGTVCIHRVYIDTGNSGWGGHNPRTSAIQEYTPPDRSWIISHVGEPIKTSGQQSQPDLQIIAGGQKSKVEREIDNLYKEALDSYNKLQAEATVPVKGVPVNIKQMLENVEKRMNEIRDMQRYSSNISSNVAQVIFRARAWGDCKWRVPFSSKCGDGTGGWYQGYVEVTQVYVGDVNDLKRKFDSEVQSTFQAINQAKKTQNNNSNRAKLEAGGLVVTQCNIQTAAQIVFPDGEKICVQPKLGLRVGRRYYFNVNTGLIQKKQP